MQIDRQRRERYSLLLLTTILCLIHMSQSHSSIRSPYSGRTFQGTLFQYSSSSEAMSPSNLVAFESDPECPRKCVLLGGLSDGLIPTPYAKELEQKVSKSSTLSWSLVQPIISSSYLGFGSGDLNRDSKELTLLLSYLKQYHRAESVVIIGHSTGCQNIVHWLKHYYQKNNDLNKHDLELSSHILPQVTAVVLQAPVSDREGAMERSDYRANIDYARENFHGRREEMMPRSAFWAPITIQRYLDLFDYNGADDFFSSDFSTEQLIQRLGHISQCDNSLKAVLVAFSGADEYVPHHVQDRVQLTQRLCDAMNFHLDKDCPPLAIPLYLPTANHNLSESEGDASIFVDAVVNLLNKYSSSM